MLISDPPQIVGLEYFRVDHPFAYYIWDKQGKTDVFRGRFAKTNWIKDEFKFKE